MNEAAAHIDLAALPTAPFWARRHAEAALGTWKIPPETTDTVVLLVCELVTNAVIAVTGRADLETATRWPIIQTLRRQPERIVIEVSDPDPNPPILANASPYDESGRGLVLVQALSKEWSYYFPPSGGKTIFCVIAVEDEVELLAPALSAERRAS